MSDTGTVAVSRVMDVALAVILVRRDAAAAASSALLERCGLKLPAPGRLTATGGTTVLWQGPDRFLAVREGGGPGLASALESVLDGLAHVVEASSSRLLLTVSGEGAAAALARILPIDLHPRGFPEGGVALTVAGHIDVQVWRQDGSFHLACASSYAGSLRALLP